MKNFGFYDIYTSIYLKKANYLTNSQKFRNQPILQKANFVYFSPRKGQVWQPWLACRSIAAAQTTRGRYSWEFSCRSRKRNALTRDVSTRWFIGFGYNGEQGQGMGKWGGGGRWGGGIRERERAGNNGNLIGAVSVKIEVGVFRDSYYFECTCSEAVH